MKRQPYRIRPEAHLSPELLALIDGVQGNAPRERSLDWNRVGRLAAAHGVGPLLHAAWSNQQEPVPPELLSAFLQQRRQNALNGMLGLSQRDDVLRVLEQDGLRPLVLKGAALARTWYGDLSLRSFLDIDLWLHRDDVDHARELLLEAGYERIQETDSPHHETPLHRAGLVCAVELHRDLTRLTLRRFPAFGEFWERSVSLEGEGALVRTLSSEDTLLHLCLHLVHHLDYAHGWRLRHLCDIAMHLKAFDIDWDTFAVEVEDLGVGRACGAVLGLAALIAGATVPNAHIDLPAALELLDRPAPGVIHHHRQGAFLAALLQGHVRQAGRIVTETMAGVNAADTWNVRQLRPHRLLVPGWRLLRTTRREGWRFTGQLRDWLPEARDWRRNERLMASLLARPDDSLDHSNSSSHPPLQSRIGLLSVALLAWILAVALRVALQTVRVRGTSMEPTLQSGQRLLVIRASYLSRGLRRGDIVLMKDPRDVGRAGIKRLMGLPGERIQVRRGRVMVDGRRLDEQYATVRDTSSWGPVTIPSHCYFVLGDNRARSIDSRHWGCLSDKLVVGRVWFSYWPPHRLSRLQ